MPVVQPMPRRRRSVRRRGLDPTLVQSFPTYAHDADKLAKGISQTPKSEEPRFSSRLQALLLGLLCLLIIDGNQNPYFSWNPRKAHGCT